jgi:hypothetical protein
MIIPTVRQLQLQRRLQERRRRRCSAVIQKMQVGGLALHLEQPDRWSLSSGERVPTEVARLVIASTHIVGVGDSLFGTAALSQTFRVITGKEK